jgi:hypothetical protein
LSGRGALVVALGVVRGLGVGVVGADDFTRGAVVARGNVCGGRAEDASVDEDGVAPNVGGGFGACTFADGATDEVSGTALEDG